MSKQGSARAHWDLESLRVLTALKAQVELARKGVFLENGQLACFRLAYGISNFFRVFYTIKARMDWSLFATEEQLADLERSVANNDLGELIQHFCIITSFHERVIQDAGNPRREDSWLFRRCGNFDEIAELRLLLEEPLQSGKATPYLREAITLSMKGAISRCFRQPENWRRWQGLMVVYETSKYTYEHYEWFKFLNQLLRFSREPLPTAAVHLFLSFMGNTIFHGAVARSGHGYLVEKETILRLLKLGASTMVSENDHELLLNKTTDREAKEASWLQLVNLESLPSKSLPSALNKILCREWDAHFLKLLSQYTCCSLDATDICKRHYEVHKVPSLKCLAAQKLPPSHLSKIDSPVERYIASKHQPFSMTEFSLSYLEE